MFVHLRHNHKIEAFLNTFQETEVTTGNLANLFCIYLFKHNLDVEQISSYYCVLLVYWVLDKTKCCTILNVCMPQKRRKQTFYWKIQIFTVNWLPLGLPLYKCILISRSGPITSLITFTTLARWKTSSVKFWYFFNGRIKH